MGFVTFSSCHGSHFRLYIQWAPARQPQEGLVVSISKSKNNPKMLLCSPSGPRTYSDSGYLHIDLFSALSTPVLFRIIFGGHLAHCS